MSDLARAQADADDEFKPDWRKYPKLRAIFAHRPEENIYWAELRELLREVTDYAYAQAEARYLP